MYHYYVGLDLGQSADYTALALIEEPLWYGPDKVDYWDAFRIIVPESIEKGGPGWVSPSDLRPITAHNMMAVSHNFGRPPHPPLYLRHLERFELGTKYTEIVGSVKRLLLREPIRRRLRHTALLVDKTGVGAAVVDSFWQAGVQPLSITIHGGSAVTPEPLPGHGFRVPKRDLVSATQTLLQNERLKIAESLELAPTLKKELLNFRVKVDPKTAHDSYEHWREGDHDDLVLATALACWYRQFLNADIERRNTRQGGFRVRGDYPSEFSGARRY
jgi:hypothetical protein